MPWLKINHPKTIMIIIRLTIFKSLKFSLIILRAFSFDSLANPCAKSQHPKFLNKAP